MKITTKRTIEEHHEIELPCYMKSNCHFYKVYSEEKCLSVTTLNGNEAIETGIVSLAFSEGNKQCSEKEFLNAYNKTLKLLKP